MKLLKRIPGPLLVLVFLVVIFLTGAMVGSVVTTLHHEAQYEEWSNRIKAIGKILIQMEKESEEEPVWEHAL